MAKRAVYGQSRFLHGEQFLLAYFGQQERRCVLGIVPSMLGLKESIIGLCFMLRKRLVCL
jgi:hypothetical protein